MRISRHRHHRAEPSLPPGYLGEETHQVRDACLWRSCPRQRTSRHPL